jgi:acetyl esterase/lipase
MSAAWSRHSDLSAVPPEEARRIAEEVRAPWTRGGPQIALISERMVPVRVRFYDPAPMERKPVLVYLHGGGWTLFSIDTHDRVMREYAWRAGVVVAGVDYALAPEAKYPVALDQIVHVLKFLGRHGADLGIDPQRIGIGGDSAGANLAMAACIRLRDEGYPRLVRAMLLNYGVFDRQSTPVAKQRYSAIRAMPTIRSSARCAPISTIFRRRCSSFRSAISWRNKAWRWRKSSTKRVSLRTAGSITARRIHSSRLAERAFAESSAWLRATLFSRS